MESVLNSKEIQEQSYDLSCTNLENCIEEQEAFSMTTVTISRNSNTAKCTEGCLQLIIHAKKESENPSKPETITPTQKPSKSFVLKNCSSQNLVYEITPIRCNGNHVKDGNGSDVHVQAQKTITLNKNGEECSASKDDKDLINVTISGGDEKLKMFNSPLVAGTVLVKFIYEGSVTEINIPPECI
ncbi:hypothetical protein TNIN_208511 [Trichonephila inaurata madagascariensis]|uniref:Uncharacterized protein n=1 Tax=Trichonephila inaurata madagascariensis TaxID=2747483 RepID=A0A8X7CQ42_9ARAC|nr:hypothetical protein TNIN_208511 [Trichonephila inaurata madagascariensis]